MRSNTCPKPGSGTGKGRSSTVLLPGSTAPSMSTGLAVLAEVFNAPPFDSCWSDDSIFIPQVRPGLVLLPKKDLSFDQAAITIYRCNFFHFRWTERIFHDSSQVCHVVVRIG